MIEMTVRAAVDINATPDACWTLLGEGFGAWDRWSPGIDRITMKGPLEKGALRVDETPSLGTVTQELTRFDRDARALAYEVRDGLPPFLESMRNEWQLDPLGDGRSRLSGVAFFGLSDRMAPGKHGVQMKVAQVLEMFCAAARDTLEGRG